MFTLDELIGLAMAAVLAITGVAGMIIWLCTGTPWNGFMGLCAICVAAIMFNDIKKDRRL